MRCLDRSPYREHGGSDIADLLGRGVTCRTIYDRSSLDHPGALAAVEELSRPGLLARVLPHLPMKLYVADDRLAFLPLQRGSLASGAAIIVHRSVQRRVAALMADLGAHTRFQAGAQAALGRHPRP